MTESTSGYSSASELTCIPAMRFCITALHNLVSRVEDSMARKEIALAVLSQTLCETVFQAEVFAVLTCAYRGSERGYKSKHSNPLR